MTIILLWYNDICDKNIIFVAVTKVITIYN